ncbi:MAG: protein kinase [Coleofasciculus sp. Co-bin14]|nr:protein kinase [Coleofasciculus sp. Co-bin14]
MNWIACTSCGRENPSESRFCTGCGAALITANTRIAGNDLQPGTRLRDRYIIQCPLGRGGFSRTYLAQDTGRFNELVALKELTPTNQGTYALQKAEELFQREAAMLHKLSSPQIPRFWEFFRDGKRLFLVQDYIEGKTYQSLLEERIASGETFSEAEIIQLLEQLLPVLDYLHSLGIIHRDISPDNIICRASDRLPILIDLGGVTQIPMAAAATVSSSQNSTSSSSATRLGKIGYAPEEQLRLGIVAPHSDLYALGVTALVLITGKQPQELVDWETMEWHWQQYFSLSPFLTSLLKRMLAREPVERFQSANELLHYLETHHETFPTQVYSPSVQKKGQAYHSAPISVNNSGCGHLFDASVNVPEEIPGWNWGAFFVPGFWCLTNQVWIGLISWADLSVITLPVTLGMTWPIMAVILGIKGNEWAWKSRRWNSVREFKRHQRLWTIAGFLILGTILLLIALIVLAILALGISSIR